LRILYLCPIIPYPPQDGGRTRTFKLLREVAARNEVHFLALADEGTKQHRSALDAMCETVETFPFPILPPFSRKRQMLYRRPRRLQAFYSPDLQERVRMLLASGRFDLVHIEEIVMAQYLLPLAAPPPVVLSRQKIDWHFEKNVARYYPWGREKVHLTTEILKLYWFERAVAGRPWHHMVPGERDRELSLRLNRRLSVSILPNGTDTEYFQPRLPSNNRTISFIGTMCYEPNVDGIHYFFEQVYPHIAGKVEGLQIHVVGHSPIPSVKELALLPGVVVTGTVPDVRPYFANSALSFVPLRIGGGSRIKILDAMAMGIPVVSTTVGAEGIDCTAGEDIFIADRPEEFAARIVQLLNDPALRQHLGLRGRQLVEQRYSWRVLGEQLEAIYADALTAHAHGISAKRRQSDAELSVG
jgi:sugar transferase (PEP-CTERM/EpsH1 system associated)